MHLKSVVSNVIKCKKHVRLSTNVCTNKNYLIRSIAMHCVFLLCVSIEQLYTLVKSLVLQLTLLSISNGNI